jgi:hypothetical protein
LKLNGITGTADIQNASGKSQVQTDKYDKRHHRLPERNQKIKMTGSW